MRRAMIGLVAAVTMGAAMAIGSTPGSADAASGPCPTADGVTVVVDFRELGGGIHVRCAPGRVESGFDALTKAGIDYSTAIRSPGFLCRIAGRPADDPCINTSPATAYWSYWVAPRGGQWCFSNWGAGFRTPPAGSVEGWSFSLGRTSTTSPPPGVPPPAAIPGVPTGSIPGDDCAATGPGSPTTSPPTTRPPHSTTTVAPVRPPTNRSGSTNTAGTGGVDASGRSGSGSPAGGGPAGPAGGGGSAPGGSTSGGDPSGSGSSPGASDASAAEGSGSTTDPADGVDTSADVDSHDDLAGGTNDADPDGSADRDLDRGDAPLGASGDPGSIEVGAPVDLDGGRSGGGSVTGVVMAAVLVGVIGAVTLLRRRSGSSETDA